MNSWYPLLADLVLTAHAAFAAFVVITLPVVLIGGLLGWGFIRNTWFRLIHLGCIGLVVVQAWLGMVCPLTTLEMWLRLNAGDNVYSGSFIQYWLSHLLYYEAPAWVFATAYSIFGLLTLLTIWLFPPGPVARHLSSADAARQ